jgi:hypothetical protein
MLPAISADLPAYLIPPKTGGEGRQTGTDKSDFGPAARVDVSKAAAAQSQDPNQGLYGPDGQFVETAARRETEDRPAAKDPAQGTRHRDLVLSDVDAIIPPAASEELRALADHVSRKAEEYDRGPREHKRVADLMTRVGRHHDAVEAMARARELEEAGRAEPSDEASSAASSRLEAEREAEQDRQE